MNIKQIIYKTPREVKATFAFFLANVISKGITYITTPIFTRLLSSSEYGQVSLYNTWSTLFGYLAMFSLSGGVFNNGMSDFPNHRNEFSYSLLTLSNIITIVFSGVLILIYPILSTYINLNYSLLILMCISFLVKPAYQFWYTRQRYELNYKNVMIYSVSMAVVSQGFSLLFVLLSNENKSYARIAGSELSIIFLGICFYFYIGIKAKWKIQFSYWKSAFLFNLPLLPHYLSMYLLENMDKIMIANIVSDSATAFYSIAYSISTIALVFWSSIDGALLPYVYKKCKNKEYESINKVTLPIMGVFAGACLGIIMFGPEIVKMMATKDYLQAIYVIPPIIGGCFFQMQYTIYANIVYYYKRPQYVMLGSVIAAILNMLLNYIFIRRFGYYAAGYTTLFCYSIQALIDYYAMRKVVKEKIYNTKWIVLLSVLIVIISIGCTLIYDKSPMIRYAIVAIMGIMFVVLKKRLFEYFSLIRVR